MARPPDPSTFVGVPVKLLQESEGHTVTIETNTGEIYRGRLVEAEENMNCQLSAINVTYRDGRVSQLENIYIRGTKIRFIGLPDMLKDAGKFKRILSQQAQQSEKGGRGGGRGGSRGGFRSRGGSSSYRRY